MASEGFSVEETLSALASISESLRGLTWLTLSELALIARVPEATLNAVLTPLSNNHKTLQMIRIEKARERPNGKGTRFIHYYRPFADMTVHACHFMGSKAGQAANEASVSVEVCLNMGLGSLQRPSLRLHRMNLRKQLSMLW